MNLLHTAAVRPQLLSLLNSGPLVLNDKKRERLIEKIDYYFAKQSFIGWNSPILPGKRTLNAWMEATLM